MRCADAAETQPLQASRVAVCTLGTQPVLPQNSPRRGDIVGDKYELVARLGQGGMGQVWVAVHRVLRASVALKLFGGRPAPWALEFFLAEATAAARVSHPSCVSVYDCGIAGNGAPFIVMALLVGDTLARRLATRGPYDPVQAVRLMLPIADALRSVHDAGIVHRDVKPSNIVLEERGGLTRPVLLDFGIAQVGETRNDSGAAGVTTFCGTPNYMAPEQVLGDPLDRRCDIWGFCAVLCEMVIGAPLFQAKDTGALLARVLEARTDPPQRVPGMDRELWTIVERGLRGIPEERWSSFDGLGAALARWLLERGVEADASGAALSAHWALGVGRRALSGIASTRCRTFPVARRHSGRPRRRSLLCSTQC